MNPFILTVIIYAGIASMPAKVTQTSQAPDLRECERQAAIVLHSRKPPNMPNARYEATCAPAPVPAATVPAAQ